MWKWECAHVFAHHLSNRCAPCQMPRDRTSEQYFQKRTKTTLWFAGWKFSFVVSNCFFFNDIAIHQSETNKENKKRNKRNFNSLERLTRSSGYDALIYSHQRNASLFLATKTLILSRPALLLLITGCTSQSNKPRQLYTGTLGEVRHGNVALSVCLPLSVKPTISDTTIKW